MQGPDIAHPNKLGLLFVRFHFGLRRCNFTTTVWKFKWPKHPALMSNEEKIWRNFSFLPSFHDIFKKKKFPTQVVFFPIFTSVVSNMQACFMLLFFSVLGGILVIDESSLTYRSAGFPFSGQYHPGCDLCDDMKTTCFRKRKKMWHDSIELKRSKNDCLLWGLRVRSAHRCSRPLFLESFLKSLFSCQSSIHNNSLTPDLTANLLLLYFKAEKQKKLLILDLWATEVRQNCKNYVFEYTTAI